MAFTIIQLRNLTSLADPEWTKEETDYLFNLIREYDSRFYIVKDRYDFPEGPKRSMEVSHDGRLWPSTYSGFAAGYEG
jgi:DNA methyltransferase 1-associated protein 1